MEQKNISKTEQLKKDSEKNNKYKIESCKNL